MSISKKHITKKITILILSFFIGIMSTVVTAVTYDSNVETRANTILNAIKSNASKLAPSEVSAYYALMRMNIQSLMQVLTIVDENLSKEINSTTPTSPSPASGFIDFQANNCIIPVGKSLCMATLYVGAPTGKVFTVKNPTRGITSANIILPNNYSATSGKYVLTTTFSGDDAANMIKYGENQLELYEGDKMIARAVNVAECITGTKWNGQICANVTISEPKPTISLNRTPKVLKQGQSMMMSWNTTNATSFSYYCTGKGIQANKKVAIELNKAPYSDTWENLIKIGWEGVYECDFVAVGPGGTTVLQDSFTIENNTITPNPGQEIPKLTFTCTKSVYSVGENISCKISGGTGTPDSKLCYQSGTSSASREPCLKYGWSVSGNDLIYNKPVISQMIGDYTLFVEDSNGNKSSTVVVYKEQQSAGFIDFQANNCIIPVGKSLCMATLYVGAPTGKVFTVKNPTRGITSANIILPNNYSATSGKYVLTTTFSGDDAANMIKYGENQLELYEGDKMIARAVNVAECITGTKWNGQICEANSSSTQSGTLTFTIGNGVLTKNRTTGDYTYQLPGATPFGLSCYYRPSDIISSLSSRNLIPTATSIDAELLRKLTSFVSANGGNTTGPDPYGILAINYPNVGAYCPGFNIPVPVIIDFQANNCKIAEGKSSCISTLYIGAPTGKTYTLKNNTRSITSTNIITPNNYSVSDKKYILTGNSIGGDAANYIRYGENTLSLIDGDKEVSKAINSGECEAGLQWNGSVCTVIIKANPTSGIFNISEKNTLIATISGVTKENTLICNEIIAHPSFPSSVNTGFCSNPNNFKAFNGNDTWKYSTDKWIGTITYNSSIYGNAGIKTRTFWKDKSTNFITIYDIVVQ